MSDQSKRFRQLSIFESFESTKKLKTSHSSTMSENDQIKAKALAASESRILSNTNMENSLNKNPLEVKDFKKVRVDPSASCSTNETTVGKVKLDHSAISSTKEYTACSDNEDGFQNSGDLFSDQASDFKNSGDLFPDQASSLQNSEDFADEAFSLQNSEDLFPDQDNCSDDFSPNYSTELLSYGKDSESQLLSQSEDSEEQEDEVDIICLNRRPACSLPLPKLEPSDKHSIMFSPHIRPGDAPRPYPSSYRDRWDSSHVRMPCSPNNRYPVGNAGNEMVIESRWNVICWSLRRDIRSSKDLEDAIMSYNSQYTERWNFRGLHAFLNKCLTEEERDHFFEEILPAMVELALNLPNVCTQSVPLLKRGKDHYLTMSQKQIGCLLSNAFFCTFPRRTLQNRSCKQRSSSEYATYPDINFNRLFSSAKYEISQRNAEKLKCLFNYFKRITSKEPSGTVTFHRQRINAADFPKWNESNRGIRTAVIRSSGLIETEGHGMLQVDFANKYVGGGVLGQGCVQEEIRFVICPELIVSRLFVECLGYSEVLIITGVEQYNKYSGYADSFKWEGDFKDQTPRDAWGRRYTQLVAMDATHFTNSSDQFKPMYIKKELNKAYCGFYESGKPANLPAIATGNWGCGAFKGNPNLKFLIQLMAASQAGRSLLYFTFGNKKLKTELQAMYDFLSDKNLAVGDVWRLLIQHAENVSLFAKTKCFNLYGFIYSQFITKEENYRQEDVEKEEKLLSDSDKLAAVKVAYVTYGDSSTESEYSIT